jgi:hypothetical protein
MNKLFSTTYILCNKKFAIIESSPLEKEIIEKKIKLTTSGAILETIEAIGFPVLLS